MGADIGALVALNTVFDLPLGNVYGNTALLVSGRAVVPRTVLTAVEGRNGQQVALQGVDRIDDLLHEVRTRGVGGVRLLLHGDIRPLGRNLDLHDGVAAGV